MYPSHHRHKREQRDRQCTFFYCVMTLNISLPPSRRAVDPRSRACSLAAPLIESAGQQRRRRRVGAE